MSIFADDFVKMHNFRRKTEQEFYIVQMRKAYRAKDLDSSCKGFPYRAKFHGKRLHCIQITKPCHAVTVILIQCNCDSDFFVFR